MRQLEKRSIYSQCHIFVFIQVVSVYEPKRIVPKSIQIDSNLHETTRIYLLKIFMPGDSNTHETNRIYLLEIFVQGDSNMPETNRIYFFKIFVLVDSNINGTGRTTFLKAFNL